MSYTKTNWQNTPSTQTPISAANLNHMEQGIYDATETAESAQSGVDGLDPRMDLVEQRLDNLIPQGTPTQGNAELIDIRVGGNGITYPTAGDAVRGQYGELKSALDDSLYEELELNFTWVLGDSITNEGVISHGGATYALSSPIDVPQNGILQRFKNFYDASSNVLVMFVAEFDNTDTFIRRTAIGTNSPQLILDDSCETIRFVFGRQTSTQIAMTMDDILTYFSVSELMSVSERVVELEDSISSKSDEYILMDDGTAVLHSNGDTYNATNFSHTYFIDIRNYESIVYRRIKAATQNVPQHGMAFYDENHEYISGIPSDYGAIGVTTWFLYKTEVPDNAVYAEFTWFNSSLIAERGKFAIYDGAKYDSSIYAEISELQSDVETIKENIIGITHAPIESDGALNFVRRCRQMTDIKWTPVVDLPRRDRMYNESDGDYSESVVFEDVFKAGHEYTGIPYCRATRDASDWGYTDMKVGFTVGFDTFISAVMNPKSVVALRSQYDANAHNACFYAIVCAAFNSYVYDLDRYYTTPELPSVDGMSLLGYVNSLDLSLIKLGDMLVNTVVHGAVISDVIYDSNGTPTYIEVSEATTVGNDDWNVQGSDVGGLCRRLMWPIADFVREFSTFGVYRYAYLDSVTYTKSPYVDTGNEGDTLRIVNFPVIPYMGENFNYKVGKIPNSTLLTHAYKAGQLTKLRVIKDGSPWNANGTTDYYDVSGDVTEVGFTDIGTYSAYMCEVSNGNETIKTKSCHWKVIANS